MFNSFYYGWFNLGSLVFGLIAWILPIVNLIRYEKKGHRNLTVLPILSMGACVISLWFQIIYNHHLVEIEDWSALMDTTGALVWVSGLLLIVTIILNLINLFLYKNRLPK